MFLLRSIVTIVIVLLSITPMDNSNANSDIKLTEFKLSIKEFLQIDDCATEALIELLNRDKFQASKYYEEMLTQNTKKNISLHYINSPKRSGFRDMIGQNFRMRTMTA